MVAGFVHGVQFLLMISRVRGIWLETSTAIRYEAMCAAAAMDGIVIHGLQGWRSNEEQTATWTARQCTCKKHPHDAECVVARLGPAAKPGWSEHQSGRAVDIHTGMTCADLRDPNSKRTPVYLWLEKNGARFGFVRTVASEPWHYANRELQEQRDAV